MRKQVYLYLYVPMKAASISVIIPNYNGKNLLQNNLPSVFAALEHAAIPYEVLVVDDCSTDDSLAFLQKKYPEVKLVVKEKLQLLVRQFVKDKVEYVSTVNQSILWNQHLLAAKHSNQFR